MSRQRAPKSNLHRLIGRDALARGVRALGREISQDYADRSPRLIGVLKGAWIFIADLVRAIEVPVTVDFLSVASYGYATNSCGEVRIVQDLDAPIKGLDVLVIEDILDTGRTVTFLKEVLNARRPRCLRVAALLDKASRRILRVEADYVGFKIPNRFVVGYGLDCAERYRQLPEIFVMGNPPSR